MLDPMKGTPPEAVELPDGIYGFGAAEMAFLLARHDTPASLMSRSVVLLDPAMAGEGVLLSGASSLVSRGLFVTSADGPGDTRSVAALVEYALGQAVRWSQIGWVNAGKEAA